MHIVSDFTQFLTRNIISCFEIHLNMSVCMVASLYDAGFKPFFLPYEDWSKLY
jgi:hypothetical protein